MKKPQIEIQIGKNGVTDGVIGRIKTEFETRERVKITLLKAAGHTKENTKEVADKIVSALGNNYTGKILGFTIFLQKWRKIMR